MPGGLHPPISVIMTWPRPNYINPERRDYNLVITTAVLLFITYVVVGLRMWARVRLQRNAGLDDAIIAFAMIPLTLEAVALCLASRVWGFDRHVWDLKSHELINSRKVSMFLEEGYLVVTCLTKISILLFYRRLAAGCVSNGFLYTVYGAIAFVAAYFVAFTVSLFFHCKPFEAFWMQVDLRWDHNNEYHCINEFANLMSASVINVVQDFICFGMPLVLFWKLQIPMRQKIALGCVFGVGFFLCITGILRIIYTYPIFTETYDMTWHVEPAYRWCDIEVHLAIVCASAPALKIYFKRYLERSTFGSSWRSRGFKAKGYVKDRSDPTNPKNTIGSWKKPKAGAVDDSLAGTTLNADERPSRFGVESYANKRDTGDVWKTYDVELGCIEVEQQVDQRVETLSVEEAAASHKDSREKLKPSSSSAPHAHHSW